CWVGRVKNKELLGINANIIEREPFSIQQEGTRFATVDGVTRGHQKRDSNSPTCRLQSCVLHPPRVSRPPRGILGFARISRHARKRASSSDRIHRTLFKTLEKAKGQLECIGHTQEAF
ncbi:hypothetical protein OAM00_06205, partial [Verrucomicrobia bacterium]|nr:hypothetical protein [Verrucomicrobiota bacterium]